MERSQAEMLGQSVRALMYAPSDPKILVAGTLLMDVFRSNGRWRTTRWERISPKGSTEIHEIESLAIDPVDPKMIYAGTWHLPWKTIDGGEHWKNIKEGIIEDSDVFSIIIDPKQPKVMYLSACSGIYASKTEDGVATKFTGGVGVNKAQGIPSTARRTRVLMQDPNHLETVFAGTTEGLYRTFDGGKDTGIQTTRPDVIVNDVYVDPADSKHVLLATDRRGVLASNDGGDSFLASNDGFSARRDYCVSQSRRAASRDGDVGVVNDKDSGGVIVSHTGGLSWSHLGDGLDGHDVFSLGQAPDGTMLAGTEHGIYRLKDDGVAARGDDPKTGVVKAAPPAAPSKTKPVRKAGHGRPAVKQRPVAKAHAPAAAVPLKGFDGSAYGFALSGDTLFAATSQGVLRSASSGVTWSLVAAIPAGEWRFVAASKGNVVAASLSAVEMSADGGETWKAVALPPKVTQVLALSVDAHGGVWVGDRDGVYFSADKGANWQTLKNLYVRNVNSLYYDELSDRILVTTNEPATTVFAVAAVSKQVSSWDTKWNLRFVRPVGDHLVAATLFDGIVVQPRMVDSAEIANQ